VDVRELSESTRTAVEAADAVGCELGQIVKSVILVDGDEPLLCLCAGDRRVAIDRLGEDVRMARANEVRDITGYAIGGVPPLGHAQALPVLMDRGLFEHEIVWAAAGLPDAVFSVAPGRLQSAAAAEIADLAEGR
jgi:prolyl-tRNA editing enzyme YbaK/EbsC (Cys-tRNA(Pro) deacylase)